MTFWLITDYFYLIEKYQLPFSIISSLIIIKKHIILEYLKTHSSTKKKLLSIHRFQSIPSSLFPSKHTITQTITTFGPRRSSAGPWMTFDQYLATRVTLIDPDSDQGAVGQCSIAIAPPVHLCAVIAENALTPGPECTTTPKWGSNHFGWLLEAAPIHHLKFCLSGDPRGRVLFNRLYMSLVIVSIFFIVVEEFKGFLLFIQQNQFFGIIKLLYYFNFINFSENKIADL